MITSSLPRDRRLPLLETKENWFQQPRLWLWFFVLFKFSIHFLFLNPAYDLHRDEYLYLDQANHLAWGFLEVPPVLSVFAFLTKLLGNGIFWVKFWPALFGALTVWVMGSMVLALGGRTFAIALASMGYIFSGYLRLNLLFQPNSLDTLLWTAYFYWLIRYIQTQRGTYLLYLGIGLGVGLLNKYTVGFFIIGTIISLLFTPQRQLFRRKEFYLAALLAFVLVLPNIIWQVQHQLPFFRHMTELNESQLQHVRAGDFLKDQLIMCLGALPVWLLGLGALLFTAWGQPYRLLGFIYLLVLLLLLGLHGKNYYTLGLYPMLLAAGSTYLEKLTQRGWYFWLRPVFLVLPLLLMVPVLPIGFPLYPPAKTARFCAKFKYLGILRWEDGQDHLLPQDFADMLGWQELTRHVAATYKNIPAAEKARTIILCDNYGQAGAINYYGRAYHLPPAYSQEASYLLWLPQPLRFSSVILVGNTPSPEHQQLFSSIQKTGEIKNPYARENGTKVLLLSGAREEIIQIVNDRIKKEKAVFGQ